MFLTHSIFHHPFNLGQGCSRRLHLILFPAPYGRDTTQGGDYVKWFARYCLHGALVEK